MIYLDNASTTPIHPDVLEAMRPYLTDEYANPGTIYSFGRKAKKAIDKARTQVADFMGAEPEQMIFTSGGTEANNTVYSSVCDILKAVGKTHIITTKVEHDSVIRSVNKMCIKQGFDVTFADVTAQGFVEPHSIENAITDKTGLVSVMYVNNETGAENPVEDIGKLCREHNILFHTDCVQAAGSFKLDVKKIGCDFASISSHKIHGPKGIGALFVKDKSLITPIIYGGAEQEFGLRGGTENVPAIAGFGKACEIVSSRINTIDKQTSLLKQLFYGVLIEELKTCGLENIVHINGDSIIKHGKILNIRFDKVDGETLLLMLDAKNICVSAGSACRSHESEPSNVLLTMGLSPDEARNAIRISFSMLTESDEVITAAKVMADCVKILHN